MQYLIGDYSAVTASLEPFPVLQPGLRWLWDEVEAACHWWRDAGSPGADRWWFAVTPDGQRVQLS